MKIMPPSTRNDCRFGDEAASHFTGEFVSAEFNAHLENCPSCQQVGQLLHCFRTAEQKEPSANLTDRIIASIKQPAPKIIRTHFYRWAAAAAVIVGITAVGISFMSKRPIDSLTAISKPLEITDKSHRSSQEALDWFCRTQEADGSWSAVRWGGDRRFQVALTALPMLAILSADAHLTLSHAQAISKARNFLRSACDTNGRFGPQFYGESYSQGIATLAMLTCYKDEPDESTKRMLDNALAVIVSRQSAHGWWGMADPAQPNLSITLWQLEALKTAVDLGWTEMRPHLDLGTRWVGTQSDLISPVTDALTSGGNLDYFNAYFATAQLRESQDETSRIRLASIRHALRQKQVQSGSESGSWTPDDRWGQVGGRLYTTALASLALK